MKITTQLKLNARKTVYSNVPRAITVLPGVQIIGARRQTLDY